jgi:hypothetical protein
MFTEILGGVAALTFFLSSWCQFGSALGTDDKPIAGERTTDSNSGAHAVGIKCDVVNPTLFRYTKGFAKY